MRVYFSMKKPVESSGWEASNVFVKDTVNTWSSVAEKIMAASTKASDRDGNCSCGVEEPEAGLPWVRSGRGGEGRPGILTTFHGHD